MSFFPCFLRRFRREIWNKNNINAQFLAHFFSHRIGQKYLSIRLSFTDFLFKVQSVPILILVDISYVISVPVAQIFPVDISYVISFPVAQILRERKREKIKEREIERQSEEIKIKRKKKRYIYTIFSAESGRRRRP